MNGCFLKVFLFGSLPIALFFCVAVEFGILIYLVWWLLLSCDSMMCLL